MCNACTRKRQQHGYGASYQHSVNYTFATLDLDIPDEPRDVETFLASVRPSVLEHLEHRLYENNLRWYLSVQVRLTRETEEGTATIAASFASVNQILLASSDADAQFDEACMVILSRLDEFIQLGSGWAVDAVIGCKIHTAIYNPIGGSASFPTMPKSVRNSHSVLNIQNDDDRCFMWCILAAIHPPARPDVAKRPSVYRPYVGELSFDGLDFPIKLHDIPKFERLNVDISVNVLAIDDDGLIVPRYISPHQNRHHKVDLLLLEPKDDDDDDVICHYTLIKNLSRLLARSTLHHGATFVCRNCLHRFTTAALLAESQG